MIGRYASVGDGVDRWDQTPAWVGRLSADQLFVLEVRALLRNTYGKAKSQTHPSPLMRGGMLHPSALTHVMCGMLTIFLLDGFTSTSGPKEHTTVA